MLYTIETGRLDQFQAYRNTQTQEWKGEEATTYPDSNKYGQD